MKHVATYQDISRLIEQFGACSEWVAKLHGLTIFKALDLPEVGVGEIEWLLSKSGGKLGLPALAEYKRIEGPALAEYERIKGSAWAEYERIVKDWFRNAITISFF